MESLRIVGTKIVAAPKEVGETGCNFDMLVWSRRIGGTLKIG